MIKVDRHHLKGRKDTGVKLSRIPPTDFLSKLQL